MLMQICEFRLILRANRIAQLYGLWDGSVTDSLRKLRALYVEQIGMRRYLSDMLGGDVCNTSCGQVALYNDAGMLVTVTGDHWHVRLIDYLCERFDALSLPFRVETIDTARELVL